MCTLTQRLHSKRVDRNEQLFNTKEILEKFQAKFEDSIVSHSSNGRKYQFHSYSSLGLQNIINNFSELSLTNIALGYAFMVS